MMKCCLCKNYNLKTIENSTLGVFKRCSTCSLIQKTSQAMGLDDEKEHYLNHHYELNQGYRKFLLQLATPMQEFIKINDIGLDFGCGHKALMPQLFKNEIHIYDSFFYPEIKLKKYDFIIASEVVEHFKNPYCDFTFIIDLLKTNGIVGIMTSLYDNVDFSKWYYKNDLTHRIFFSKKTFEWIKEKFSLEILKMTDKIIILKKRNSSRCRSDWK